jgi:PiT family inorganic phosphate transporter
MTLVKARRSNASQGAIRSGRLFRHQGRTVSLVVFLAVIAIGALYVAIHLATDLGSIRERSVLPFLLLGVALLIGLRFEFVNGFHDTANAVATVIYTNSLAPHLAVVWSGRWNFVGVLISSGAVAFGIIQLLPVELILQVGSGAGFAMVYSLLIAAILWNLGIWHFGLPSSSSHTLIGSIIGVGLMNEWISGPSGTSGVDWAQAAGVSKALLFSPVVGFILSALLLLVLKVLVRAPQPYREPKANAAAILDSRSADPHMHRRVVGTRFQCDGQKGMGLIMLILIGVVPTAYALNKAVTPRTSSRRPTQRCIRRAKESSGISV